MGTQFLSKSSRRLVLAGVVAALAMTSGVNGLAQAQAAGQAAPPPPAAQPEPAMPRILVTAGRSTVLATDFDVTRIALTNPAVADATVVAPREILIDGKAAGTISLIVWGPSRRTQYDLVVEQPVAPLQQQLQALFPGEHIEVSTNEDATVLSGNVSSTNVMLRAAEIAKAVGTKRSV
jgi:pilus assembly protein CpaC